MQAQSNLERAVRRLRKGWALASSGALCVLLGVAPAWSASTPSPFLLGVNIHANRTWECATDECLQAQMRPGSPAASLPLSADQTRRILESSGYNSIREFIDWGWVQPAGHGPFETIPNPKARDPALNLDAQFNVLADPTIDAQLSPVIVLGMLNRQVFNPNRPQSALGQIENAKTFGAYTRGLQDYVKFVLDTYPRVHMIEFGNEFNAPWGLTMCPELPGGGFNRYTKSDYWAMCKDRSSARNYVRLLAPISRYVKETLGRRDVQILSQGLADNPDPSSNPDESRDGAHDGPWLKSFVAEGGMQYVDGLSIHTYDLGDGPQVLRMLAWVNTMHQELQKDKHYVDLPWYLTEVGWPTGPWGTGRWPDWPRHPISEQDQATNAVQFILLARTLPFVRGVWWYDLVDDGPGFETVENNYGQVRFTPPGADAIAKPMLVQMQCLAPSIKDPAQPAFQLVTGRLDKSEDGIFVVKFRHMPDGRPTWAVWSATGASRRVTVRTNRAVAPVRVYANACEGAKAVTHNIAAASPLDMKVGAAPVFMDVPPDADPALQIEIVPASGIDWRRFIP